MKKTALLFATLFVLFYAHSQPGTLEPSFAGKGWTYVDFQKGGTSDTYGKQTLVQKDGTYILVLNANSTTMLARYHSNGTLDTGFATDGYSQAVLMSPTKAVQQSDGKIVVAGSGYSTSDLDFSLVRYNTDGSVDNSFGRYGRVLTDFGLDESASSIALQSDGKIVAAGISEKRRREGITYDFVLARYNRDGSLDSSFDVDGKVSTDFTLNDQLNSIAIQGDGKIVVGGATGTETTGHEDITLVRYNSDGSLDSTFDKDGSVTTAFPGASSAASIAIQSDRKIVLGGTINQDTGNADFVLARYNRDGSLDSSFSEDGKVSTDFFGSDHSSDVTIQNDGKILIAGETERNEFALARYNSNGTQDSTFDKDGSVTTAFEEAAYATSVAIQNDGKMVMTGYVYINIPDEKHHEFALSRYNTNGSLDKSFDNDGKLTGYSPVKNSLIYALAVQHDGKAVVAGYGFNPQTQTSDFPLARYNTDGSPDSSFGENGKVITDFGGDEYVYSIAIQDDGKIIAGGYVALASARNSEFALARYNSDGSLDSTFGKDGKVTTDMGGSDYVSSIALQSDGKIVATGTTTTNTPAITFYMALARYKSDGSLDSTFDGDGKVITSIGVHAVATSIVIQTDGKIVIAGDTQDSAYSNDAVLARYNTDGSLDSTFDQDGKVTTDLGGADNAGAIALQSDGKIILAGSTSAYTGEGGAFALVRYNTDGSLDSSFDKDGKLTTDFGSATSIAIQDDGKIVVPGTRGGDFGLARYNIDGSLDSTFDGDGRGTTDFGGNDQAEALAIYQNRIYVGGSSYSFNTRGILAAYQLDCKEQVFYKDSDKDGYGNITEKVKACTAPLGYVADSTDCNDSSATMHLGAHEICGNGLDDNCNGQVDEGCPCPPFLTINNVTVYESEQEATLTVTLSKKAEQPVCLLYFTVDGTAKGLTWYNRDYKTMAGVLSIPTGSQSGTITIPIYKDNIREGDEYFDVFVFQAGYAVQGYEKGRITIKDGAPNQTTPPITQKPALEQQQANAQAADRLSAEAYPNPSTTGFTLFLKSSRSGPVVLTVRDGSGRLIERKIGIAANTTLHLGSNYGPGVYYAELMQGKERIIIKLVKQSY